ncbi:MAG: thioredoxin domain-containing protein [Patescibacteria group bacterium]|nr:DsbA family protein [Patescibacteria group bacterium]MDE1988519.1 thioredoxin domain-containing protein [Patescibacteria group bacterium]MDE2217827.1 thioredoxin domain-containing protein [Patescibacteria group bacterium]
MEQQKRNPLTIPFAIVVAGALIAGTLFLTNKNKTQSPVADMKNNKNEITIEPVSADDHILGNPEAPIMIVEFSDTECPFCKNFNATMRAVIDAYGKTGKVAWVYRHFPIDQLHSKSRKEAEATECAAELGGNDGFWKYIDALYKKTPSNNDLDPSLLPQIAEENGLDGTKFESCLNSGKYAGKVEKQYQDAVAAGGQGTPYTVIITKHEKIPISEGAIPFSDGPVNMKMILDDLVGKN